MGVQSVFLERLIEINNSRCQRNDPGPDTRVKTRGPSLWIDLPEKIRQATSLSSFTSPFKTHLFQMYFYVISSLLCVRVRYTLFSQLSFLLDSVCIVIIIKQKIITCDFLSEKKLFLLLYLFLAQAMLTLRRSVSLSIVLCLAQDMGHGNR